MKTREELKQKLKEDFLKKLLMIEQNFPEESEGSSDKLLVELGEVKKEISESVETTDLVERATNSLTIRKHKTHTHGENLTEEDLKEISHDDSLVSATVSAIKDSIKHNR